MERVATQRALSRQIHLRLNDLGFGQKRLWERIHTMNKVSTAKDISTKRILNTNRVEKIFVGSQREGTGYHFFNDLDILQINHGVACCIQPKDDSSKVTFQLVQKNAPPGYFFLKLVGKPQQQKAYDNIKHALVDTQQGTLLSSKLFMERNDDIFQLGQGYISANTNYKPSKGPSIPKYVDSEFELVKTYLSTLHLKEHDMDYVRAFPCEVEHVLQAWRCRNRIHNWPSPKTIRHVLTVPAHVVPVGQTGSPQEHLQWRLCFTLAEIHLVQSFNNTQTKVFVLLKLIAKYYLKPVCSCMTSYTMKNVALWLAETMSRKKFRQKHLLTRLYDALQYLQGCVRNGSLPSYMIPERNLFAGKLQPHEQETVLAKLDFLLQHGPALTKQFFFSPNQEFECVNKIAEELWFAEFLDKLASFKVATLTCEQLAEYNTVAFLEKSRYAMAAFTFLFYTLPAIYTFGICAILPDEKTLGTEIYGNLQSLKTITESRSVAGPKESDHTPNLDTLVEEDAASSGTSLSGVQDLLVDLVTLLLMILDIPLLWFNLLAEFHLGLTIFMAFFFYCQRNYSRQTYIENLTGRDPVVRTYIPRDLYMLESLWFRMNLCFTVLLFLLRMTCTSAPLNYYFYRLISFKFKMGTIVLDWVVAILRMFQTQMAQSIKEDQQLTQVIVETVPYVPS